MYCGGHGAAVHRRQRGDARRSSYYAAKEAFGGILLLVWLEAKGAGQDFSLEA